MRHLITILLFVAAPAALAQGFSKEYLEYPVYQGDFDGDGDIDIYVRERPDVILISYEIVIPIVRAPNVVPFVLPCFFNRPIKRSLFQLTYRA